MSYDLSGVRRGLLVMKSPEPLNNHEPKEPRALILRRMRALAILLLGVAIIGLCVSHYFGGKGIWGWSQAFFESAVVGSLADWFAVVALFKRPFGIPIPHTAIIPKSKGKLAHELSYFIRDNFLEPRHLVDKLTLFDPAEHLGQWLSSPTNVKSCSTTFRDWTLHGLGWLDDDKLKEVMTSSISQTLLALNASQHLGQILTFLTEDNKHRDLLETLLHYSGNLLSKEEFKARFTAVVIAGLEKDWPIIMGAANAVKIGPWASKRLISYLPKLLNNIKETLQNPDDETRNLFEKSLRNLIERLQNDPILINEINTAKQNIIASPAFSTFTKSMGDDIYVWLKNQLNHRESGLSRYIEKSLTSFGKKLQSDPVLRESINRYILDISEKLVQDLRNIAADHISETINRWDDKKIVREVELSLGKDLQFIRFNGTLVGGLVGIGLHGLQWLLPTLH